MNIVIVIGFVIALALIALALRVRSATRLTIEQARREAGVQDAVQRGMEPKGREW
jgi:hypothetical protein